MKFPCTSPRAPRRAPTSLPFLPHPRRRDALAAALGLLGPSRFDIMSRDDPRPGLAEVSKIARNLAGKVMASTKRGGDGHG